MSALRRAVAVMTVAAALSLAGCAAGSSADTTASPGAGTTTSPAPELTGELTVFAAASLSSAFDELATQFAQLHRTRECRQRQRRRRAR